MPQFPRQSQQPLSPRSIRGATRRIRELADSIEARADATEAHDRAMLTRAINGLASAARELARRHGRISVAEEMSAGDPTPLADSPGEADAYLAGGGDLAR